MTTIYNELKCIEYDFENASLLRTQIDTQYNPITPRHDVKAIHCIMEAGKHTCWNSSVCAI